MLVVCRLRPWRCQRNLKYGDRKADRSFDGEEVSEEGGMRSSYRHFLSVVVASSIFMSCCSGLLVNNLSVI